MRLLYKQLARQIGRNKVFVSLLLILTCLTSLSFFFVMFSVDGNMAVLDTLTSLTENQRKYKDAILSNTRLAYIFLFSMALLTALVFVMFFYRFFRSAKKQIGCVKSLGFTDSSLRSFFVIFTACISFIGAAAGMCCGYFLSDILIKANEKTCSVEGLVRAVSPVSAAIGLLSGAVIYCFTAYLSYFFIRGKEPGLLINGKAASQAVSGGLSAAERIVKIIPVKDKFPLRIALRKPLAVFLIFVAVMAFNVCFILGRSLNISSQKIRESQTKGHYYQYNTGYTEYKSTPLPDEALPYLYSFSELKSGGHEIKQSILGLYSLGSLFELFDGNDEALPVPQLDEVYINPELAELYQVHIGDTIQVDIEGRAAEYKVAGIAANAQLKTIYVNAAALSQNIGAPAGSYNRVWSMEPLGDNGTEVSSAMMKQILERDATSNQTSAVINQVIGAIIGCILLFLALYLNFQDNQRDISILNLLGYSKQEIRKMMIYIYRPIVCTAFVITLIPSILLARYIQKSLSAAINDYMPFGINIMVLLLLFISINLIYLAVECTFSVGILRMCKKQNLTIVKEL